MTGRRAWEPLIESMTKTVFRGAWGKYIVPSDVQFPEAPLQAGVNFLNNLMVTTTNGEQTPNNFVSPGVYSTANTLDNPYPNGLDFAAPPQCELPTGPARRQSPGVVCQRAQR